MRRAARTDDNQTAIIEALQKAESEGLISPKKLASAMHNLEKAKAANKVRPSTQMEKPCLNCGVNFKSRPSHFDLKSYCSKECMGEHYKTRLAGKANPNFRSIADKFCNQCGNKFASYLKGRKFCSPECYRKSVPDMIARLGRSGTDANQPGIVKALRELGVSVFVTSKIGHGFPDIIAGYNGINFLFEIKNPDNQYGKKGMTKSQKEFAETWQGEKPIVIYSVDDAVKTIWPNVTEAIEAIQPRK